MHRISLEIYSKLRWMNASGEARRLKDALDILYLCYYLSTVFIYLFLLCEVLLIKHIKVLLSDFISPARSYLWAPDLDPSCLIFNYSSAFLTCTSNTVNTKLDGDLPLKTCPFQGSSSHGHHKPFEPKVCVVLTPPTPRLQLPIHPGACGFSSQHMHISFSTWAVPWTKPLSSLSFVTVISRSTGAVLASSLASLSFSPLKKFISSFGK